MTDKLCNYNLQFVNLTVLGNVSSTKGNAESFATDKVLVVVSLNVTSFTVVVSSISGSAYDES